MCFRIIAFFLLPVLGHGQAATKPRFEDYLVSKVYRGRVKPPQFGNPAQYEGTDLRCFGGDPAGYASEPVNFAGHFVIGTCTCGSGCHYVFMWDVLTGKFYGRPFGPIDIGPFGAGIIDPPVEYKGEQFRADSSLLILDGCIEGTCDCATRYYRWSGTQFKLLLRQPSRMPPKCEK